MARADQPIPDVPKYGSHDRVRRATVIELTGTWVDAHTPKQIEAYLTTVLRLHAGRDDLTLDQTRTELKEQLPAAGVALPEVSYHKLAEHLHESKAIEIITDDGRVLFSDDTHDIHQILNRNPVDPYPEYRQLRQDTGQVGRGKSGDDTPQLSADR